MPNTATQKKIVKQPRKAKKSMHSELKLELENVLTEEEYIKNKKFSSPKRKEYLMASPLTNVTSNSNTHLHSQCSENSYSNRTPLKFDSKNLIFTPDIYKNKFNIANPKTKTCTTKEENLVYYSEVYSPINQSSLGYQTAKASTGHNLKNKKEEIKIKYKTEKCKFFELNQACPFGDNVIITINIISAPSLMDPMILKKNRRPAITTKPRNAYNFTNSGIVHTD